MALPPLRRVVGLSQHRIAAIALLAGISCLGLGVGRVGWGADVVKSQASVGAEPVPARMAPPAGAAPAAPLPAPSTGGGGQAAAPAGPPETAEPAGPPETAEGSSLPGDAPRILHRVVLRKGGWCALSFQRIRAAFHESNPGWEEWIWGADEIAELLRQEGRRVDQLLKLQGKNFTKYFASLRRQWVKQTDAVKYVLLLLYGGLVMDLDVECRKPVDPLVTEAPVVLRKGCKNNWLWSWPDARLWVLLLRDIVAMQDASKASAAEHTGEERVCALLRRLSLDGSWGGGQCPHDGRGACRTCEDDEDDRLARSACSRNSSVFFVPVATIGEFHSQGSPLAPGHICVHRSYQSWKHKPRADNDCSDVLAGALHGEALMQRSTEVLAARKT